MRKVIITIVITGILLFACWWVIDYTKKINKKIIESSQTTNQENDKKAQAEVLEITETEKGKKIWELKAATASYIKKEITLKEIQGQFYQEDSTDILITFKSDIGKYNQNSHKLELKDNVEISNPENNIIIKTKQMLWSKESKDLKAYQGVEIIKSNFSKSYGDKAIFSTDFNKIILQGKTYTEITR